MADIDPKAGVKAGATTPDTGVKGGAQAPAAGAALKEGEIAVPQSLLETIQKQLADAEIGREEDRAKIAGLEQMVNDSTGAKAAGETGLREKKTFEPKFRTARMRKYPIAGDISNLGYVVGWTSRGAYQEVDRSGVAPAMVDYIDVIFLGKERNADGKLQAEKIKLLDLLNKGEQVNCIIKGVKREEKKVATNEEINVTVFDPAHGLTSTGDTIDGFVTFSETTYTLSIPGIPETVDVDGTYVNA